MRDARVKKAIELAHQDLDRFENQAQDSAIRAAIWSVRDMPEVEAVGLRNLAWSMYKDGCTAGEARWFLDTLEARLKAQAEEHGRAR